MLRSQLYEIELKKKQEQRADIEAGKMKIEWVPKLELRYATLQISERCSNRARN
jgi:hypothetical protein